MNPQTLNPQTLFYRVGRHAATLLLALCSMALCAAASHAVAAGEGQDQASAEQPSAHAVLRDVTDDMLNAIEAHKGEFEDNPEPFFNTVAGILDEVVDFRWIARGVMHKYYEDATPEQRRAFVKAFREGLVETYAKGMMSYSNQNVVVLPPEEEPQGNRVTVEQEIRAKDQTYPVSYTMARNREGEWKLLNVILNGVNLGYTFRNQFAQAMNEYDGDIDQVIANWNTTAAGTQA